MKTTVYWWKKSKTTSINEETHCVHGLEDSTFDKDVHFPKLIHKFNVIPMKIQARGFLIDIVKIILNFIWSS